MKTFVVFSILIFSSVVCFAQYLPLNSRPERIIVEGADFTNHLALVDTAWICENAVFALLHSLSKCVEHKSAPV